MCSGSDSSTRVHCVLPLKRFTGKPWTNPSMWPSLCKSSTCSSDRNYCSTSLMTGKVENVWGGGEGVMKLERFLLPYPPFRRTCVGLRGGLKSHQNLGGSGSVELQCKLRFSHATCLLNEQHTALLLHWWGNRWPEDIPEHAKPYFQRLGLHVWQACCSGSQMNFSFKNRPPIAKRNKSALSPFRVRECFVVVLCGSELRLLPSWVSSFSVFQHGCNTWKHAVWERSKGRREFCSANDSIK